MLTSLSNAAVITRQIVLAATGGGEERGTCSSPQMVGGVRQKVSRRPTREEGCPATVALREDNLVEKCHLGVLGLGASSFPLADELHEPW